MAETFLKELIALTAQLFQKQKAMGTISCKHFFSGAAAHIEGQIFMSLSPVGLALKLPEDHRSLVLKQGGKALKYFPKSPIKKGYAVLTPDQRQDFQALSELVNISIDHVLALAIKSEPPQ